MPKFLNFKYGKIVLGAVIIAVIALFMFLTTPKPAAITKLPTANGNQPGAGNNANANVLENENANAPKTGTKKTAPKATGFALKTTPHYVSSNVANNATLTQMPAAITINFDAPINKTADSYIYVKRDDVTSVTQGQSYIGSDRKTLSVNLNQTVKNGDYYVYYVACFADTGCKDGRFGFHLKLP